MRSKKKPRKTEADKAVFADADTVRKEASLADRKLVAKKSSTTQIADSKKLKTKETTSKKSENPTKHEANQMNKLSGLKDNEILPEIPELDEILELPKNVREEAFVRAVCTAHKAKLKANKKVKQNLAWLHTESEN